MKKTLTESLLWTLFLLTAGIFIYLRLDHQNPVFADLSGTGQFFVILTAGTFLYILYCAVCACFYRPVKPLDDENLPGCTVIVPAYNEGAHVAETIKSILNADYPADKLEIIAIDDGSRDDTWEWIEKAASFSDVVKTVKLPKNCGKKHALVQGINMSRHEVIVTVDSDSIVRKSSLRAITSHFADASVHGVAGNIRIKNLDGGILPKMMDVGFMFGFEVIRSAQSISGCVMCTPGAMSAYRKSALLPNLDRWLKQTFLGTPARTGEDRAIATMILEHGGRILFEANAVTDTCIPANYNGFCRMLIRWTRSDIRENYLILKHTLKRFAPADLRWWNLTIHNTMQIFNTIMPALILPVFIWMFFQYCSFKFAAILCTGVAVGIITSIIPAAIYARRVSVSGSVWAPFFSIYNIFALSWIALYSFLTMRNASWLTRELPENRKIKYLPFF